jgi:hypothetical protein
MQSSNWQAKLARSNLLGRNLQHSLMIGETAGLHLSFIDIASDAQDIFIGDFAFYQTLRL